MKFANNLSCFLLIIAPSVTTAFRPTILFNSTGERHLISFGPVTTHNWNRQLATGGGHTDDYYYGVDDDYYYGKGKGADDYYYYGKGKGEVDDYYYYGEGKGGKGSMMGSSKSSKSSKSKGEVDDYYYYGKGKGEVDDYYYYGKGKGGVDDYYNGKDKGSKSKGSKSSKGKGGGYDDYYYDADCYELILLAKSEEILEGSSTTSVGETLYFPVYDAKTKEAVGVYTDEATNLEGDDCLFTGALSFDWNEEFLSYDSQINVAATCSSTYNSITGGSGAFGCATGYAFATDEGVTEDYVAFPCGYAVADHVDMARAKLHTILEV